MNFADADTQIERLCDTVVAAVRAEAMLNNAPADFFADLERLRRDPMLKEDIRAALRNGDQTFPHCDEVRERLGWDR
jgi:hypothetical protein